MAKERKRLKVGITCGDINGIGTELIFKTFSDQRMLDLCVPVVYGSVKALTHCKKALRYNDFHFHVPDDSGQLNRKKLNVINVEEKEIPVDFGKSTPEAGALAFKALKEAVNDLAATKIDVLVTAPINKENIQAAGFNFPGHTEFLADYANEDHPLMILLRDNLRVGLVTGHLPLKDVPGNVTKELILNKLDKMNTSLLKDFNCTKPKIAVLGLNPHAGEGGVLGDEENTTIKPAVDQAMKEGIYAFGPYPADGFFGSGAHHKFDGVLAMYHDQGLAPFKALSFGGGVNFTAGLPIVRTSPDHGTAYDIAGKGIADPGSFREAVYTAVDISHNRSVYKEAAEDPLQTQTKR